MKLPAERVIALSVDDLNAADDLDSLVNQVTALCVKADDKRAQCNHNHGVNVADSLPRWVLCDVCGFLKLRCNLFF